MEKTQFWTDADFSSEFLFLGKQIASSQKSKLSISGK